MAYEKNNRGVLFKNDRKEADTHADYQGTINVDGKDFWLNAWIKDNGKGKFFSLSVKPKVARDQSEKPAPKYNGRQKDDDDSQIPF